MESPNLAYRPDASPAFALRWSWTGWPSMGDFPRLSDEAFFHWNNFGNRTAFVYLNENSLPILGALLSVQNLA